MIKIGAEVYFRDEYSIWKGEVVRVNKKSISIKPSVRGFMTLDIIRKPLKDVVLPNEDIALVWETWKGVNGCGGYRLEKVMYTESRTKPYVRNNFEGVVEDIKPPHL